MAKNRSYKTHDAQHAHEEQVVVESPIVHNSVPHTTTGKPPLPMPFSAGSSLVEETARVSGRTATNLMLDEAVRILSQQASPAPNNGDGVDDALSTAFALQMWQQMTHGMTQEQAENLSNLIETNTDVQEQLYAYAGTSGQIASRGGSVEERQIASDQARETIESAAKGDMDDDQSAVAAGAIVGSIQDVFSRVESFLDSDDYQKLRDYVGTLDTYIHDHSYDGLLDVEEETRRILPFLHQSVEEHNATQPTAVSLYHAIDILTNKESNYMDDAGLYADIFQDARSLLDEYEKARDFVVELERVREEIPRIKAIPSAELGYPLDKVNSTVWNLLAEKEINGQLGITTQKHGTKSTTTSAILYSINFDELGAAAPDIVRRLTPFDKRVYIASASLYNAGNRVFSISQIYRQMGNRGSPKSDIVQKINDSLTKMGTARVHIDNKDEINAGMKYPSFKYDAALLPFERVSAYINNVICESAIHLFREPPIIAFARERGQISNIPIQVLESPVSKTDANLILDDYLLERIAQMKNNKRGASRRMLFDTLYKRCSITTKKQRQRVPEKIRRYLDHYQQTGFIRGYTMEADGVTIDP